MNTPSLFTLTLGALALAGSPLVREPQAPAPAPAQEPSHPTPGR